MVNVMKIVGQMKGTCQQLVTSESGNIQIYCKSSISLDLKEHSLQSGSGFSSFGRYC